MSPNKELGETYRGLLDDDVFDDKFFEFQALGVGISLGVLQEAGNELDGFLRPTTCGGDNDKSLITV